MNSVGKASFVKSNIFQVDHEAMGCNPRLSTEVPLSSAKRTAPQC